RRQQPLLRLIHQITHLLRQISTRTPNSRRINRTQIRGRPQLRLDINPRNIINPRRVVDPVTTRRTLMLRHRRSLATHLVRLDAVPAQRYPNRARTRNRTTHRRHRLHCRRRHGARDTLYGGSALGELSDRSRGTVVGCRYADHRVEYLWQQQGKNGMAKEGGPGHCGGDRDADDREFAVAARQPIGHAATVDRDIVGEQAEEKRLCR
ncbi:hypothetical protein, partial [Micromonospora sonneratiae]